MSSTNEEERITSIKKLNVSDGWLKRSNANEQYQETHLFDKSPPLDPELKFYAFLGSIM